MIEKKIVARSRLRSTIDPPPKELPPPPMPKAPERPASLPECRSTRKIRMTEMKTWTTERNVYTAADLRELAAGLHLVEAAQDLHRLAAQLRVLAVEVLLGLSLPAARSSCASRISRYLASRRASRSASSGSSPAWARRAVAERPQHEGRHAGEQDDAEEDLHGVGLA